MQSLLEFEADQVNDANGKQLSGRGPHTRATDR